MKPKRTTLPQWQLDAANAILSAARERKRSDDYNAATRGGWEAMPRCFYPKEAALILARHDPATKKTMKREDNRPRMCPDDNPPRWK